MFQVEMNFSRTSFICTVIFSYYPFNIYTVCRNVLLSFIVLVICYFIFIPTFFSWCLIEYLTIIVIFSRNRFSGFIDLFLSFFLLSVFFYFYYYFIFFLLILGLIFSCFLVLKVQAELIGLRPFFCLNIGI